MKRLALITILLTSLFAAQADAFSLAWTASPPSDAVTGYNVYEASGSPRVYTLLGSTGPTVTTFSIGTPAAGVHYYAVTAVNLRGESSKSAEAILPSLPVTVTGLKVQSP
jgi:hypothetical protein